MFSINHWGKKNPQVIICLFIFAVCSFVYLANQNTISSSDNFPNSLLAFNWLINHTLHFDAFRDSYAYRGQGDTPYFLVEAPNRHLTSTYPIGVAIITFPIYAIFFLYLKLSEFFYLSGANIPLDAIDLTSPDFRAYREAFEKLAATIATSIAVVIFYLSIRLKVNTAAALVTTFVFAFATNTWVIGSQGLWQHGIANLVLLSIIFCLFKANRTVGTTRKMLLLFAGIFCGLLPGVRPTSLLFSLAAIGYALFTYCREAAFLVLGLASAFLSASWNCYYFGFHIKNFLVGGYSRFSETSFLKSYYQFTFEQFQTGFLGSLFSPSRGLLIFSPVVVFALPGISQFLKQKFDRDEKLIAVMVIVTLAVFGQYCFFEIWTGGWCFGPRYMTDILPIVCLLIGYFIQSQFALWQRQRRIFINLSLSLFFVCLTFSTFTQVVGAFGATNWDGIPYPSTARVWQWRDSQIERFTRHVFFKMMKPLEQPRRYLRHFSGAIEQITDVTNQPLAVPLIVKPHKEMILKAALKNTGKSQWYGYETGMERGSTRVKLRFLKPTGEEVKIFPASILYISGMPKPGDAAEAIGAVTFPSEPGVYQVVFDLFAQGMRQLPDNAAVFEQTVQVAAQPVS